MFRHRGKARTIAHNLSVASLLSFVAGLVNVCGLLAVQRLTTNITGHFAFLIDEVFSLNFLKALAYFLYIFFFLLGSFISNFLVELLYKAKKKSLVYLVPVAIESIILVSVAWFGEALITNNPDLLAYLLLFAMGMQNSLVTSISNAIVRTTHLTGLFTDLGIELSQLFFYRLKEQRQKLLSSIKLRVTIITFFFFGGLAAGILYPVVQLHALLLGGIALLLGITFDYIRLRLILIMRKYRND